MRDSLAPKVIADGPQVLAERHFEVVSDWSDDPQPLDPATVDWQAVADGSLAVHVRQQPGPDNMLGRIVFMFPNRFGVYLHDTPDKAKFRLDDRRLSSGCVRLEDADLLARWLLGPDYRAGAQDGVASPMPVKQPVPVYITYLTALPDHGGIRFQPDVYGRDNPAS